jgi:hypothetical protein
MRQALTEATMLLRVDEVLRMDRHIVDDVDDPATRRCRPASRGPGSRLRRGEPPGRQDRRLGEEARD